MKKFSIFLSLALSLFLPALLTSCDDDKNYPPVIVPEDYGSGAWNSPISVNQVLGGSDGSGVWMSGYIVGWIDTGISNAYTVENVKFSADNVTVQSNIILAASPDETDITKCVPIQLVSGSAPRSALNLKDHPENLGKLVSIKGNCDRYFGTNGFKSVSAYNWGATGIEETTPDTPDTPSDATEVYKADKSAGLSAFTFDNILLPEGATYIWKVDTKYGLVASSFFNKACHASDAWAVSPVIDLSGYKDANFSFRHAANKFDSEDNFKANCSVAVRIEGGDWTTVSVPNMDLGMSWTFQDSGTISIRDFAGKKIQLGFHYTSTDAVAGSWEIDNISVKASK